MRCPNAGIRFSWQARGRPPYRPSRGGFLAPKPDPPARRSPARRESARRSRPSCHPAGGEKPQDTMMGLAPSGARQFRRLRRVADARVRLAVGLSDGSGVADEVDLPVVSADFAYGEAMRLRLLGVPAVPPRLRSRRPPPDLDLPGGRLDLPAAKRAAPGPTKHSISTCHRRPRAFHRPPPGGATTWSTCRWSSQITRAGGCRATCRNCRLAHPAASLPVVAACLAGSRGLIAVHMQSLPAAVTSSAGSARSELPTAGDSRSAIPVQAAAGGRQRRAASARSNLPPRAAVERAATTRATARRRLAPRVTGVG